MTETLTTNHEQVQRPVEIIHYPDRDVIINRDSEYAHLGHQLAELFKDGTPADWEPIGPMQSEYEQLDNDPDNPGVHQPKPGSARGEVDGVQFMVKPKYAGSPEEYHRRKSQAPAKEYPGRSMKTARLFNSVLHEIAISPQVKAITASDEAQAIARTYGYKGVKYIEPVIAVIDKRTGNKSLVFEYIDGAENLALHMHNPNGWLNERLSKQIDDLLKRNGISSNNHDGEQQFMTDKNKFLYHIDAESYSRIK